MDFVLSDQRITTLMIAVDLESLREVLNKDLHIKKFCAEKKSKEKISIDETFSGRGNHSKRNHRVPQNVDFNCNVT